MVLLDVVHAEQEVREVQDFLNLRRLGVANAVRCNELDELLGLAAGQKLLLNLGERLAWGQIDLTCLLA